MSYDPIPETGIKVPMVRSEGAVAMTASRIGQKCKKFKKFKKKLISEMAAAYPAFSRWD